MRFKTAAKACARTFIEAAAIVVLTSLLGFCLTVLLGGCGSQARLPNGEVCERVEVSGDTSYVVAYLKDDGWYLSAPGAGASTVHAGQILTLDHDARMGVIAFVDAKGRAQAIAHNWNERGPQRKFCLQ